MPFLRTIRCYFMPFSCTIPCYFMPFSCTFKHSRLPFLCIDTFVIALIVLLIWFAFVCTHSWFSIQNALYFGPCLFSPFSSWLSHPLPLLFPRRFPFFCEKPLITVRYRLFPAVFQKKGGATGARRSLSFLLLSSPSSSSLSSLGGDIRRPHWISARSPQFSIFSFSENIMIFTYLLVLFF